MTTPRQIIANRLNSGSSTGPRTALGKSRSAANARIHGLASIQTNVGLSDTRVATLASWIASEGSAAFDSDAHDAADATIALIEIRRARSRFMAEFFQASGLSLLSADASGATAKGHPPERPGTKTAPGLVAAFGEVVAKLARIDRYERRALSRRKKILRRLRGENVGAP